MKSKKRSWIKTRREDQELDRNPLNQGPQEKKKQKAKKEKPKSSTGKKQAGAKYCTRRGKEERIRIHIQLG